MAAAAAAAAAAVVVIVAMVVTTVVFFRIHPRRRGCQIGVRIFSMVPLSSLSGTCWT